MFFMGGLLRLIWAMENAMGFGRTAETPRMNAEKNLHLLLVLLPQVVVGGAIFFKKKKNPLRLSSFEVKLRSHIHFSKRHQ